MRKRLVFENKTDIESAKAGLERVRKEVSEFRAAMNALPPVGQMVNTPADLATALNNPEQHMLDFIKNLLPSEEAGVPVDKEARIKTLKLPIMKPINEMARRLNGNLNSYGISPDMFVIEGSGVNLSKDTTEQILDKYRVYANNSDEERFIELNKNLVRAFNDFKEFYQSKYTGGEILFSMQNFDIRTFMNLEGSDINYDFFTRSQTYSKK